MKMRTFSIAAAALAVAGVVRAQAPNFSNYVSLGDSLTAGWESGCLVDRHQLKSYPARLATSFGIEVAGVGDNTGAGLLKFQQPLVSEPGLPPCYVATFNPSTGSISIGPPAVAPGVPENLTLARPYNNLGIPGAHSYDLIDRTSSDGTDLYGLILRNTPGSPFAGTNAVEQAIGLSPTFLTLWIGNNDILDAIGSATVISPSCAAVNQDPTGSCDGVTLTPVAEFTAKYTQILQTLRGALPNTSIVVLNLPDALSIPFATTLPPFVVDAQNHLVLGPDGQPIPLIGQHHDGTVGPISADTLVTLAASAYEAQGIGIPCAIFPAGHAPAGCDQPLPDGGLVPAGGTCNGVVQTSTGLCSGVLLYADEIAFAEQRNADLNAAIATAASAAGAKLLDANALLKDIKANGRTYAGITVTSQFLTGGIFSYDGVHPNNAGYAIVADEIIKFLNATYGTSLPRPNMLEILQEPDVAPSSESQINRLRTHLTQQSLYPHQYWQRLLDTFGPVDPNIRVIPVVSNQRLGSPAELRGVRP